MAIASRLDHLGEQVLLALMSEKKPTPLPAFRSIDELACSLGTHVGHRRNRNDDCVVISRLEISPNTLYTVALVCDGVGSSERGDEAAALACASAISYLSEQTDYLSPKDLLKGMTRFADDVIRDRLRGSGFTTFTAVLASNRQELAITSIGDSRAYSWESGSDLIQLIEDDTLENELKQLNIAGKSFLNERGLQGSLSQALGEQGRESKDLNITVLDSKNIPPGGILVGSDGLWRANQDAFDRVAKNSRTPSDLVRRTITSASWLGGVDNSSAIAINNPDVFGFERIQSRPNPGKVTVWTPWETVILFRSSEPKRVDAAGQLTPDTIPPAKQQRTTPKKQRKPKKPKTDVAEQLTLGEPDNGQLKGKREILAGPDED